MTPRGIEAALVDLAGSIVAAKRIDLSPPAPEESFRVIGKLVDGFRAKTSGRMVLGIGLAMPGPFDVESMSFVGPTTLESWRGVAVAQRLSERTGFAAFVETDMVAAALGESLHGAGRNVRAFYYLYFGVGLGGSMVKDGVPLRGFYGNAGEIGHVPLVPNGQPCSCGNTGCLERYVSLEAYQRRAPVIGHAAWIAEAAPLLRNAIVTIENLFDPETVVIGGIMDDALLSELAAAIEPLPTSVADRKDRSAPRIMRSASGQDAVLRGAASLAFSGVLSPRLGRAESLEKDTLFARSRVA